MTSGKRIIILLSLFSVSRGYFFYVELIIITSCEKQMRNSSVCLSVYKVEVLRERRTDGPETYHKCLQHQKQYLDDM